MGQSTKYRRYLQQALIHASVNQNLRPGDVAGGLRREEDHEIGHLVRPSISSHGNACRGVLDGLFNLYSLGFGPSLREIMLPLGTDRTRSHIVDPNTIRRQFVRQGFAQPDDARPDAIRQDQSLDWLLHGDGGEVHDAPARRPEMR